MNSWAQFLGTFKQIWKVKLITIAGVKLSFGSVFIALVLLLFAGRLSRLMTKLIHKRLIVPFVHDKNSQATYQTFSFYASFVGFVTLSLTIAGIPLTVFTVVGGALAIGVGFGSQNIVNNFISGVILLVEQPIRVGDTVELDNIVGTVVLIGTRSTKVRTIDNKVFIVPNSFFLEKSVLNWGYETSILRSVVNFGVSYGSDAAKVASICREILEGHEGVEVAPPPKVVFEDFGDNNLNFQIVFHCDLTKVSSLQDVRSNLRFKINQRFKEHGIEMAFPQRDVNLKLAKQMEVKVVT